MDCVTEERLQSTAVSIRGPLVPIMPAFQTNGALDIESTCQWIDWLIESGIRIFWTTYGTSHFMTLVDEEILELTQAIAAVTRGRAVLIVSTSYSWPEWKCRQFIKQAAIWGADAVKLQVDWRWAPDENSVFSFYSSLAATSPLPLFAYTITSANNSGMTTGLLQRLLELPQYIGMKNDSGDFYEQCQYLRTVRNANREFLPITGGSMLSFYAAYNFGARAFATGVGMCLPQRAIEFAGYLGKGKFDLAAETIKNYEEAIFDFQKSVPCSHWANYHTILMILGHFKSNMMRFPMKTADSQAIAAIERFVRNSGLFKT